HLSLFCNPPPPPELYPLSLYDALPISAKDAPGEQLEAGIGPLIGIAHGLALLDDGDQPVEPRVRLLHGNTAPLKFGNEVGLAALDRKSTRLNSSHVKISYAVFCLKKKK